MGNVPLNDMLEEAINQMEQDDDGAGVKHILEYLTKHHRKVLEEELRRLKLIPRILDE